MGAEAQVLAVPDGREPWFTQHPRLALGVAAASAGAVFILRLAVDGTKDSISMLYVFPVALVALGFGFRAGTAAGVIAVGLLITWTIIANESLSPLGWLTRVTPLLLLGTLVGASSDRMLDARRAERYATAVALLQRDAAEINDSVVQGLAATKWLLEAGEVERAITILSDTTLTAQQLVTRVLGSKSILTLEMRRPQFVTSRRVDPPAV
ncbi:MAG: hypothetical protein HY826_14925 [Actinobacteria bacterium]|nr:hypothetical protein [Actinomycetota bacterium]